jgi:uncharacterized protein (UPF0276 family)
LATPIRHSTNAKSLEVGVGWRHRHYAELLDRKPPIDFVEVHSENFFASGGAALAVLERGRAQYPVSLHGVGLSLGSVLGLDEWHLERLHRLVERVEPVRVSDHAAFARGLFAAQSIHAADLLPLPFTPECLDVLCANVGRVQDRLGRALLVENLSAYLRWNSEPGQAVLGEAEFLVQLARRSGCGLLVDVNNIYVNARNAHLAGLEPDPLAACRRWLDTIPADVVGEIHLAGHCRSRDEHGDIFIDDHGSRVCPEVWAFYRHALERYGMVPTLIEWDTDVPTLDILLAEAAQALDIAQQTRRAVCP